MKSKITGVGSYIPEVVTKNEDFLNHEFLNNDGSASGIEERRYLKPEQTTSDIAAIAGQRAIDDADGSKEDIGRGNLFYF